MEGLGHRNDALGSRGKNAARDGGAPSAPSFLPASRETSYVITSASTSPDAGWHSRGYLPHWDHPGVIQSVGFRLHDAVPAHLIERWKAELGLQLRRATDLDAADDASSPVLAQQIELLQRIRKYEDAGHGACWLRNPKVAEIVEKALLCFDGQRYNLIAWCVMPNHVHAIVETREGFSLAGVMHSWKSYTATEANKVLARRGPFWYREYYDRYVRNAEHYTRAVRYIVENPVKAGLVKVASEWRFSSARRRSAV